MLFKRTTTNGIMRVPIDKSCNGWIWLIDLHGGITLNINIKWRDPFGALEIQSVCWAYYKVSGEKKLRPAWEVG